MAVKNEGDFYPTEYIVSKKARKHYRIPVRSQHWQLRSLISAEKRNIVYFPGGSGSNHVQRLNIETLECETIKLLTFAPRCLVAENGWLCCGSENGEFVAIRLDDGNDDAGLDLDLDPDTRLPLDLDNSREDSIFSLLARARRSNKSLIAKSMKLAKDRVNCITLWFPPISAPACDEAYTEPVAVLANNDRTVTLVSLQDFDRRDKTEPLDVITYPDFVNRAIISPDGKLLIAILDDPYLYIHHRVDKRAESKSRLGSSSTERQWEQVQRILLKSQRKDDRSDSRGSFAACFSNSGAYLAVGTQHGTVSIFKTALLSDPDADPLITTFQSSRPQSGPGAIRDMAFCPGPFDILAWTEDRGNVGIADMRSEYIVRQIVSINEDADFEHVNILDRNTIDPRLLAARREQRDHQTASAIERRSRNMRAVLERQNQHLVSAMESTLSLAEDHRREIAEAYGLNYPLSATERMLLDSVGSAGSDRRRLERPGQRLRDERPTGISSSSWADRPARRPPANEGSLQGSGERSRSVGRAMGDTPSNYGDEREHTQDRVRSTRQLFRVAVNDERRQNPTWMDSLGEAVAAIRERRERQERQDRQDPSYFTVLEILQARERSSDDREHDDTSLLVPLVNQVVTRWEESAIRGTLAADHGVFEVPPSPDNTAGLAWSEDGRILFVGAQNGIYEFHIDIQSRKFYPSIDMR